MKQKKITETEAIRRIVEVVNDSDWDTLLGIYQNVVDHEATLVGPNKAGAFHIKTKSNET
jgi:hypothetical protein